MEEYIYIYGANPVSEYLKQEQINVHHAWIVDGKNKRELCQLFRSKKIAFDDVERDSLSKLVKTEKHQGVCLEVTSPKPTELDDLIMQCAGKPNALVWMLDQIEDPHNLGAIMRSAAQFDVDAIIMLDRRQVGVNATVVKTSAGACFMVKHCLVNNLTNAIESFKRAGYWIYATGFDKSAVDVKMLKFDAPSVVIVGNEGDGVSAKLIKHSDQLIYIPMFNRIDSLNVSVASGILMYQIRIIQNLL